ncbi:MAG: penicillin-binding protein 2 [Thermoleophilia bacterium]
MPSLLSSGRQKQNGRRLPSLALRAGALGGMAILLFATLIFRIWFLQVLSGDQYVAMAENNRIRYIAEEAPRGLIYDRSHKPLVENRAGLAVTVFPDALKDPQQELADLGAAIQTPVDDILKQLELHKADTYSSVVVKKDISPEVKSFLIERIPLYFPGVDIKKLPLRDYPSSAQAAHVLGHVGPIDEQDLKDPHYQGHNTGDEVGKDGVEYQFDQYLKGIDGGREVEVDAGGRPKREVRSITAQKGNNIVLSLDTGLQKAAEDALVWGIDLAHSRNYQAANGGAAIVMNPRNGEIYAMASFPAYDPRVWVGGISDENYQMLTAEGANDPLLNRAISGQYPPASTFKVVTSLAGLQENMVTPLTDFTCTGVWDVLSQPFKCWGVHGDVALRTAIIQSCDTYFYNVGYRFYKANNQGMQRWGRELGLGGPTGVDIPGEAIGRVPDPEWKRSFGETDVDKTWLPGDSVNLAIGQGDMLATPLQMATVYSIIANGGRSVKPHVGLWVEDKVTGSMVANLQPEEGVQLPISVENLKPIQEGLAGATAPGSTVGDTFVGFPVPVAGKTGTAQVAGKSDYGWYVAYAPADDPQVVVLVLLEQGGGGSVAAPTARKILEAYFAHPLAPATAPATR